MGLAKLATEYGFRDLHRVLLHGLRSLAPKLATELFPPFGFSQVGLGTSKAVAGPFPWVVRGFLLAVVGFSFSRQVKLAGDQLGSPRIRGPEEVKEILRLVAGKDAKPEEVQERSPKTGGGHDGTSKEMDVGSALLGIHSLAWDCICRKSGAKHLVDRDAPKK